MSADIKSIVKSCGPCQLLNAKRNLAHKHYRAKLFCTPRTAYSADYYGVYQNKQGYNNILGIIDQVTNKVYLIPTKNRTAETTAEAFLYHIILTKGPPLLIHSDAAREFISKAMTNLCRIVGCTQTNTMAHNPRGNAKIERLWQFVAKCLRQMSDKEHENFHLYCRAMEHAWDTTPNAQGITPFELEHGMPCRPISAIFNYQHAQNIHEPSTDEIAAITTSTKAFSQIAHNYQKLQAQDRAKEIQRDQLWPRSSGTTAL